MPVATAPATNQIFNNPLLMNLNKLQKNDGYKISHVKKVMILITDDESVKNSEEFLAQLKLAVKKLPTKELGNITKAKNYVSFLKKEFQTLGDFFSFIEQFEKDDKNAQKLIKNLTLASSILNDMIDYMNFTVMTYNSIEEIKKAKKYTFTELKLKLAA